MQTTTPVPVQVRQEFTRDYMKENCGCYSVEQLVQCSFMKNEIVTLTAILNSEIPLKDKFWFVCKKLLTKEQNQKLAIDVAEMVLPIYEEKYPGDSRVRDCIEATKQFLAGHISLEDLLIKRRAADSAYDDAAAAAAADAAAAAAAAYAAAYAAYAAAYAAYAAADSAADSAADTADAAANIKGKLLDYLIKTCSVVS
jgi:hypothetical protein